MLIDPNDIAYTEFAVTLLRKDDASYQVPVTPNVCKALAQMLQTTLKHLGNESDWSSFDCAEQYASTASLKCLIDDPSVSKIKDLYTSQNLPVSADALSDASKINYYFVRFRDNSSNECLGVRKASYFQGAIRRSYLQIMNDQLTIVESPLFRLDLDFDFLIFSDQIAIHRPIQFERIAELESELIKVTPAHIRDIATSATYINLDFAENLAKSSVRARRLIAAIRSRSDLASVPPDRFYKVCQDNGICLTQKDGKWLPEPKHEIAFLEMLDRRRYNDPLIEQQPTAYRAAARNKVL